MAHLQPETAQIADEKETGPPDKPDNPFVVVRAWKVIRDVFMRDLRRGAGILGAVGFTLAVLLALWVQYRVDSVAPLAQPPSVDGPSAVTGISWFGDSKAVAIGSHRKEPATVGLDGARLEERDTRGIVGARFGQIRPLEDLPPAVHALAGLPADDGEFYIWLPSVGPAKDPSLGTDILTPGGLFAIDGNGYPVVTGAASVRDSSGRGRRTIVATGADPGGIWQVGREQGSGNLRTMRIGASASQITAFAFLPRAEAVAVGAIDGGLRLVATLSPGLMSGREQLADDIAAASLKAEIRAHTSSVLSLAAARGPNRAAGGADLASIASDRSIKLWRVSLDQNSARQLASLDVAFAGAPPDLIYTQGGLELSPSGETLLLRSPAGALFAVRIGDGLWAPEVDRPQAQQAAQQAVQMSSAGQVRPQPLLLREVILPVRTTAATLSEDGRSLFAAGSDCIIREVDLGRMLASAELPSSAPIATEFGGHGGIITHLALSPDGAFAAATSLDQRVRIHRLDRARTISAIALSDLRTGPACASTSPIDVGRANREIRRVFVQFAGSIIREDMIAFAQRLRDAGWNVQGADRGGERTEVAAGLNIIRYGANDDQTAAARLAQQVSRISPAGRSVTVQQVRAVAAGTLEIWISN